MEVVIPNGGSVNQVQVSHSSSQESPRVSSTSTETPNESGFSSKTSSRWGRFKSLFTRGPLSENLLTGNTALVTVGGVAVAIGIGSGLLAIGALAVPLVTGIVGMGVYLGIRIVEGKK